MVPFGAFVELEPGVDGLVHISQIANKHVVKPEDELKVGEIINVKVLEVNPEQKKISLSKRQADAPVEEAPAEEAATEEAVDRLVENQGRTEPSCRQAFPPGKARSGTSWSGHRSSNP